MWLKFTPFSFAQWQYRSQWGLSEARLLLIENFSQYPAVTTWNIVGTGNFWQSLRRLNLNCVQKKKNGEKCISLFSSFSVFGNDVLFRLFFFCYLCCILCFFFSFYFGNFAWLGGCSFFLFKGLVLAVKPETFHCPFGCHSFVTRKLSKWQPPPPSSLHR